MNLMPYSSPSLCYSYIGMPFQNTGVPVSETRPGRPTVLPTYEQPFETGTPNLKKPVLNSIFLILPAAFALKTGMTILPLMLQRVKHQKTTSFLPLTPNLVMFHRSLMGILDGFVALQAARLIEEQFNKMNPRANSTKDKNINHYYQEFLLDLVAAERIETLTHKLFSVIEEKPSVQQKYNRLEKMYTRYFKPSVTKWPTFEKMLGLSKESFATVFTLACLGAIKIKSCLEKMNN
jgi:hypothetical protein